MRREFLSGITLLLLALISPGIRGSFPPPQQTIGTLQGSILLDDDIASRLSVTMLDFPSQAHTLGATVRLSPTSEVGCFTFEFEGIAKDSYCLDISTFSGERVTRVENIVIHAGRSSQPAELQRLDLRGRLREISFRVRNSKGEKIWTCFRMYKDYASHFTYSSTGELSFLIAEALPGVSIHSQGYRAKSLKDIDEDQLVTLDPAIEAIVRINPDLEYKWGLDLGVWLFSKSEDFAFPTREPILFDTTGQASVSVPSFGKFQIIVCLLSDVKPGIPFREVNQSLHIIENEGQILELDINQEEWDRRLNFDHPLLSKTW